MDKKRNNYSENRESARILDCFPINYKIITRNESEKIVSVFINRRTSNRPASKRYDADAFFLDWSSLENEVDYNPFVVQIFSYLDNYPSNAEVLKP